MEIVKRMIDIRIGDSRQLIKEYDDNTFDCVMTSPPFKDEDIEGDYWIFYDYMFHEMMRVSSKLCIIIHSATKMNEIISKYPPKRTLICGKGLVKYSWRYNPIFVYQKTEDYKVNKYIWSDVFGIEPIQGRNKSHVYQDPELLYCTILKMFRGIKSVLDPFAGSGTTGRSCRKLELDCTLFEIDNKYLPLLKDNTMNNYPPLNVYL